ncbi:MAG: ADP-ribosylglycohydrolase family protein [Bacilli bacterium]|nr:ADP-ribosylglycohydrolase family protein [Bacilli bacterium]MDD4808511.1 ADP-ribosylglycohydrolase family protein [Bacilli bacterium]
MTKFKDAFFGFVIGDCMGVPLEFKTREGLMKNPTTEMLGFGSHSVPAGSWSDDTSMTIATMDSIIEKESIDYKNIMEKWYEWVVDYKYTPCNFRFDIGHTCFEAIYNYSNKNKEPLDCGLNKIKNNGNGSLMRMLPIVFYCYYKKMSEKETIELVNNVSSLTHAHDISKLGCYIYTRYIMYLLDGKDKNEAYDLIKKIDYAMYSSESIEAYDRVLKNNISKYKLDEIQSTGYVVSTLEAVLWVLLNTDNFKQAIIGSINLGDDTDTVGAICGSLAGIIYGFDEIPDRWLNKILRKEYLLELANKFEEVLNN